MHMEIVLSKIYNLLRIVIIFLHAVVIVLYFYVYFNWNKSKSSLTLGEKIGFFYGKYKCVYR